jgi:hypothetical protein
MANAPQTARQQAIQIAWLVLTFCVLLNAAFYFLSDLYFADRATRFGLAELAQINGVRAAFAIFTVLVGVGAAGAAFAPRLIGHGLALAAGVMSLIGSFFAFGQGLPGVLGTTMLVLGGVFPVLVWRSLARSRGAWSFLIATCAVYSLILLFGAPKVRGLLGIGLWHALIAPGMLAVAAAALAMLRGEYQEIAAKTAPAPVAPPAVVLEPAERERRRKTGVATMAIGLLMIVVGMILVVLPTGMGMAATFVDFGLVLAGVIAIVRGYLHVPRA